GLGLAAAAFVLQWIETRFLVRAHPGAVWIGLFALGFLALGVWVGAKLFRSAPPAPFAPNIQAQAALGITEREYEVLGLIAAGRSNKEIAQKLAVSPNTVKTHVARLFEKLQSRRRTEALVKARELGLIA